jgi:hypothetical protein
MFNSYGFGGYLLWALGPQRKVFIDGRAELYEEGGVFTDYMHISLLKPGALSVLRGYGVQACLLDRNEPLANVLAAMPDWQLTYSDAISVIFVRRSNSETALLKPAQGAGLPEESLRAWANEARLGER